MDAIFAGPFGRANGSCQIHRQPPVGQWAQVGSAALCRRHFLRSPHHLPVRGGTGQVGSLKQEYVYYILPKCGSIPGRLTFKQECFAIPKCRNMP